MSKSRGKSFKKECTIKGCQRKAIYDGICNVCRHKSVMLNHKGPDRRSGVPDSYESIHEEKLKALEEHHAQHKEKWYR